MGWGQPLELLVDRDAEFDGGVASLSVALPFMGSAGKWFCQHQVIPFGAPVAVNGFSRIGGLRCRCPTVGLIGRPGRSAHHVEWVQLDRWVGITVPHLLVGLLVDRDALFDGGITSLSVALG